MYSLKRIFPYKLFILFFIVPFSLMAFTQEMELFSEAESRYYSKNYSIALEMYDEFLKKFPLSDLVPDAQYRRAVCFFRLGQFEASKSLFNAIEKRYRATKYINYVPFWKGVILFRQGDFLHSKENLEVFLENTEETDLTAQALLYKALCEVSLDGFSEAQQTMNALIEMKGPPGLSPYEAVLYCYIILKEEAFGDLIIFQDSIDYSGFPDVLKEKVLLYRGAALWRKGEINQSEEVYKELLDAHPEAAATSFRRLYIIAQQNQDFSGMEKIIVEAEEKFAGSPEILKDLWLRIGIESYNRGEINLAQYFLNKIWNQREYKEVREAVPVYLAEIFIRKGETESAEKVLDEYLETSEEESAGVMMRLGNIYIYNENYTKASEILGRVIEQYPDSEQVEEAHYLLAYCQYRLGEFEAALVNCLVLSGKEREESFGGGNLRLKALILKKLEKIDESVRALREYIASYPEDIRAHLDLVKLFFYAKRYVDTVSHARFLFDNHPDIEQKDHYAFLLLKYLSGLSQIALKSYRKSFESFADITEEKTVEAGLSTILAYVEYYRGWALYRMNDFGIAAERFSDFLQAYPAHELYPQALFMAAWCFYSLGNYGKSQDLFSRLAQRKDSKVQDKARFLQGKSLGNLKKHEESAQVFKQLFTGNPDSPYADDALFEYAGILGEKGKINEAADQYLEFYKTYRLSALAEESLYKRGEIYLNNNQYSEARSSFYNYRRQFPGGKLVDAALYWEGLAAYKIDEKRGAALLWEMVINSYERSPFRSDALQKTAAVYVELGEYRRALNLLNELIAGYPEHSEGVNAELRAEEVRYLIYGMSGQEAELTARISKKGGAKTREGRKAMIDLSRLYIFEENGKQERAFQMLSQVLEQDDTLTGAEAQFLLGEYYNKQGEHEKAGKEFFKASLKNPDDRDFMAYSIYRAAQSMKQAGKKRELQELVKRLEEYFGGTEWSHKGEKLLSNEDK